MASSLAAGREVEELSVGKGCLAEKPSGGAMDYGLRPRQRAQIAAFIGSIRAAPFASAAPVYEFYHQVRTLGCLKCHELDEVKPPDVAERIPPLTQVGARLRKEWLRQVLTQKQRVRPWIKRRMPDFGTASAGSLADLAVAAAGAGEPESLPAPTRDQIAAGQTLLGTGAGGLGCLTCHGYAGNLPNVIDDTRGPDITTVAARLRPDHFRRWVPVTFSAIDEPNVAYASTAGRFQPAQIEAAKGKVAGQVLKLAGGKVKFSVTITVKESK